MTADSPIHLVVLGADGMLGRAWRELLARRGIEHACLSRQVLDLADASTLESVPEEATAVINCAAFTDVDGAESREEEAMRINGTAVGALAERCRAVDATLVHFSTDYVFAGNASEPYAVDTAREPVNAYGRSKLAGELALEGSSCDYLLVRTSWLYAPWGKNFVRTMAGLLTEKEELRVVDDQRGRPTCCRSLAANALALLQRGHRGAWHVTDAGACSWYELTCEIARHVPGACPVLPCTSQEFPRPAKRPAYSVLDIEPTQAALGPLVPWQENVVETLGQLAADSGASD